MKRITQLLTGLFLIVSVACIAQVKTSFLYDADSLDIQEASEQSFTSFKKIN